MPELPEVETVRRGLEPVLAGRVIAARRGAAAGPALAASRGYGRAADRGAGDGAAAAVEIPAGRSRPRRDADRASGHVGADPRLRRAGRGVSPRAGDARQARPCRARHRGRRPGHLQRRAAVRGDGPVADRRRWRSTGCWRRWGRSRWATPSTGRTSRRGSTGRVTPVKAVLLDQRVVAGLGNIYVCEALWRAGVSPAAAGAARSDAGGGRAAGRGDPGGADGGDRGGRLVAARLSAGGRRARIFPARLRRLRPRRASRAAGRAARGVIARDVQAGRSSFHCPVCQPQA